MKKTKYDIISIGDPTIDTFLFIHDITIENMAGHAFARISWGDKLPVDQYYRTVAGNATNCAVGSSRLGLKAAFYTVLAHDAGGREIIHKMKQEKVATDYITIDDKHPTNASTVITYKGERTILVYHEHRKYKLPHMAPAEWVYLTSMGVGFEKIHKDLVKYLERTGAKLAYNPGTFQLRKGPKFNKEILQHTEVLTVNKEEAQSWVGDSEDIEVLSRRLTALGPKVVVITDGRKGAYSFGSEGFYYAPEFPGPHFEATGAGDSFFTAYVAALHHGLSHKEALRWGPMNAGSVVQKVGPQAGLLTLDQLKRTLARLKRFKVITLDSEKTKSRVAAMVGRKKG